jgi:PAS domain S-box-containing protein
LEQRKTLQIELEIQPSKLKGNLKSRRVRRLTECKKTDKALRQSEEKYRLLFTNMINGYAYCKMLFDKEGKPSDFVYLEVNNAFEKLIGIKKETVIGKKVTEAIPGIEKTHPELFEIYGKVARTGKDKRFEVYFKPLNQWLSIAVYSPKIGYFVAVFENITERKQLSQRLEEYSKGLELTVAERTKELLGAQERLVKTERLAAIGELAGMVGHDLRNPLAGIKNAVYFLRKKQACFTDDSGREMLSIIDKAVEHADNIVNDLLDYSREMHLELEEFSPKSLMDYVVLMVKIPTRVKIIQRIQSSPTIWVDANKIQRVFINLIKNAIDAMPNGGVLEISSRQNEENIDFIFADTGTGMPDDVIVRIFTPLFTTKAQGMGLGLVICKRIIEAHGGKIKVESALNKGTTFTLSLPLNPKNNE